MRTIAAAFVFMAAVLCTGCASITQGTTHSLRVETVTDKGDPVPGAECTLRNEDNTILSRSGDSVTVRRSSKDLNVACTKQGLPDATARLVSRANMGFAGNILLGGAIGAAIDHSSGAAYTYPTWVRLVFGQYAVFDRRDEHEGVPLVYAGPNALPQGLTPVAPVEAIAPVTAGAVVPAPTPAPQRAQGTDPVGVMAVARGDTFDYRLTNRITGQQQTVVLRADRVSGGEVSFNSGARVESASGELLRLNAAITGELDQVTPPGGWLHAGAVPSGQWKMRHRSVVPACTLNYELEAFAEGEQKLRVDGREVRVVRVALRGWVENRSGMTNIRAPYEGTAWISPELRRVVRFEARSRAGANTAIGYFHIDEVAELVRIGRD